MKRGCIYIFVAFMLVFALTACAPDPNEVSAPPLEIEVDYGMYQFPSPVMPMSFTIRIADGVITKEYANADAFEGYDTETKQLTETALAGLVTSITDNRFFTLAKNVDGFSNITDQPSRYLKITYDGKAHEVDGYNSRNKRFLRICDYIEALA